MRSAHATRRPAHLERHAGQTTHDLVWLAIRAIAGSGRPFSVAEIMVLATAHGARDADRAPLHEATTSDRLKGLQLAGYLRPVDPPTDALAGKLRCMRRYELVRDVGPIAPVVDKHGKPIPENQQRAQMWRTVKVIKVFDWRELAYAASTENCVVTADQAKYFVAALERGGYVRVEKRGGGGQFRRHCFIEAHDSGPRPPVIGADQSVMDGNTGAVMYTGKPHPHPQSFPLKGKEASSAARRGGGHD